MKFSLDNLKNIDWKQFAANHAEKIGVGVVGLLVVYVVFLGTRWSPYDKKQPEQVLSEVEKQQNNLSASTWPAEEIKQFPAQYDVREIFANRLTKIDLGRYAYQLNRPFVWKLHRQRRKYEEPTFLTVAEMKADGGRFILETLPPDILTEGLEIPDAVASTEGSADGSGDVPMTAEEKLRQRFNKSGKRAGGAAGGSDAMEANYGVDPSYGEMFANEYNGGTDPSEGEPGEGYPGEMGGGGAKRAEVHARGVRFVCVRGIYPFREQIRRIAKARHDMSQVTELAKVFTPVNLRVQRQRIIPGRPLPPTDKDEFWEDVSLKSAGRVLKEAADWEQDLYNNAVLDPVITMPLPYRLMVDWTEDEVGHPKLKAMSDKDREKLRLFNEKLQEADVEPNSNQLKLGGFAVFQRPLRQMQQEVYETPELRDSVMNSYMQAFDPQQRNTAGLNDFKQQLAATTESLLFRFFDFDVEPGAQYRYRVKISVLNPNFGLPIEQVASPELVRDKEIWTDWSEVTPIAKVPEDVQYFLDDVESKRSGDRLAELKVFQWLPDVGTVVADRLALRPGQMIGGLREDVEVVRPEYSFEAEPVVFQSDAVLVDMDAMPAPSNPSEMKRLHGDLELAPSDRALPPIDQALVVNEFGELNVIDPHVNLARRNYAEMYLRIQNEANESLKAPAGGAADGEDPLADYLGEGGEDPYDMMGQMGNRKGSRRGKKQKQNPLRGYSY